MFGLGSFSSDVAVVVVSVCMVFYGVWGISNAVTGLATTGPYVCMRIAMIGANFAVHYICKKTLMTLLYLDRILFKFGELIGTVKVLRWRKINQFSILIVIKRLYLV